MTSGKGDNPIQSVYADDPDMAELVRLFLSELPDRIASFERAWRERRVEDLARLAHQLKGAGSGYGYPGITQAAAELERELRELNAPLGVADVRDELDTLLNVCRRAMKACG